MGLPRSSPLFSHCEIQLKAYSRIFSFMMFDIEGREGKVPFNVPAAGKPCETWYIVFGDLKSGVRPLVCLHGGPGACHNYISSLSALTPRYGIPVVLYDQIGNGLSTHLQEKNGDTTFWKEDLFIDELENLLARLGIQDDYDLLGQSWGGMMGSRFAARQPKGLNKLIIADSPADMHEWVKVQNELRRTLPQETQDLMKKHEVADTVESEEYENASMEFYSRFFCRLDPMPDECVATMEWLVKKDPTVYLTVYVDPGLFYHSELLNRIAAMAHQNSSSPGHSRTGRWSEKDTK